MPAEYLTQTVSDHDLSLTITGEVEALRPRLLEALQKLGYTILGDQPIYAKRGAQGGARYDCSFEVLDYPTRLNISLKQINDFAVTITYSYEVKTHWNMTKGDRQTLRREAEAIAALASERLSISACTACATPVTDDSHFCRRCGAPLVIDVPELEVLRLTRKSRTAYHNLINGVVFFLIASLIMLPLIWINNPKLSSVLLIFGTGSGVFALINLVQGMWQLHYALNPRAKETEAAPANRFSAPYTQPLPSVPARASVTEGTTELLIPGSQSDARRTAEPLMRKAADTGEVDDEERLM